MIEPPCANDKWRVLVNPVAGHQMDPEAWEKIARLLDQYEIPRQHCFTEYPRHSVQLIHDDLRGGFRKFVMAGGDGFLNEAVNAIFTQAAVDPAQVTLALIPVGTGNDWAKTFNIPADHEAAIQILRKGKTLKHDVGRVFYQVKDEEKSSYFLNMCGIGFDAEVNKKVGADRERGHLGPMKYRYHIFTTLLSYTPTRITLVVDEQRTEHETLSLAVGIAQYNGGGMRQLPVAVPDDGLFDLSLIKPIGLLKALRSVNQLYDGSFIELPEVSTYRGKRIQVLSEPRCWLEADGEPLGQSPFRFEIIPRALQVVIG